MKYTRLNLTQKKKFGKYYIPLFILLLVISFLLGTFIFNTIFKNTTIDINKENKDNAISDSSTKDLNKTFVFIQGGAFQKVEGADTCKAALSIYGNVFTIKDKDNNIKVLIGIYNETDGAAALKKITDSKLEAAKVTFIAPTDSLSEIEICEIINAEISIVGKLNEKDVKSYNTEGDFKKWISTLKGTDKSDKNAAILEEVKSNALNFPSDLSKDKITDISSFLFTELSKLTNKV